MCEIRKGLVSVIVPAFNVDKYLSEALDSLIPQTYADWECIIVDDGSTDNTGQIANTYLQKDTRFRYYYKNNEGLAATRNFGIKHSLGEFILPLDADDKISQVYLKEAVEVMITDTSVKVVYSLADYFGELSGNWILDEYSLQALARENMIFCSAVYRRRDWELAHGYDTGMKYGWEDWELWINMLKGGGTVHRLPITGFFYRIRATSMLRTMDKDKIDYLFDYLYRKHPEFFLKQLGNPIWLANELKSYKHQLQIVKGNKFYRLLHKFGQI